MALGIGTSQVPYIFISGLKFTREPDGFELALPSQPGAFLCAMVGLAAGVWLAGDTPSDKVLVCARRVVRHAF